MQHQISKCQCTIQMSLSNKKHEKVPQLDNISKCLVVWRPLYLIDDLEQVTPEPSNLSIATVFIEGRFSSQAMRHVVRAKLHVCCHRGDVLISELAAAIDGQGRAKLKQFTEQLFFR